jgi:hypothetical protein
MLFPVMANRGARKNTSIPPKIGTFEETGLRIVISSRLITFADPGDQPQMPDSGETSKVISCRR